MRLLIIVGILIAVLGAFIVFGGISYPSEHSVVKVGGFHASLEEHREIPAWVGGIAIAGGLVLVVAGICRGH
jgi:drug/metabolite transporter (DMT)-like permease